MIIVELSVVSSVGGVVLFWECGVELDVDVLFCVSVVSCDVDAVMS